MAVITIRGVDDAVKQAIRERAARNGRSMEAELREILADAAVPREHDLVGSIRRNFADAGWDPDIVPRRDRSSQRPIDLPE